MAQIIRRAYVALFSALGSVDLSIDDRFSITMTERLLPVFDTTGSAHEVSLRWAKWKRSFLYYVEGEGLTDQKKIRSKMLHLAGLEVQDIFETLTEPVVPDGTTSVCMRRCCRCWMVTSSIVQAPRLRGSRFDSPHNALTRPLTSS